MTELTAADYAYRFPDHWLVHEKYTDTLFERLSRAYVSRAIEIIKQSGAKSVLEVGCGDGWNCGQMAKSGLDVVGIDWSENGIKFAKHFVESGQFFRADVRDEDFLHRFPNKFDALALIEVLEHIPPKDCISALMNISAPLKSGGTFVLTTPSVNYPNTNPQHYQHFTEEKLRELVTCAKLIVKKIEGYGDVSASNSYWSRMRWVDNSLYTIKPLARMLTARYHQTTNLRNTPFDCCHGFIVTIEKP